MAAPTPQQAKKPRRWPRRLLWFFLLVVLEAAAFVTLGSLLFELVEPAWVRWLLGLGASLAAPLLLAALLAGRVRAERALGVLGWGFLGLLALGAGLPWLVASDATRGAVARNGLWVAEQIAGPLSTDTRDGWRRFFEKAP